METYHPIKSLELRKIRTIGSIRKIRGDGEGFCSLIASPAFVLGGFHHEFYELYELYEFYEPKLLPRKNWQTCVDLRSTAKHLCFVTFTLLVESHHRKAVRMKKIAFLAVVSVLLTTGGCQCWNAWLDMLKVPVANDTNADLPGTLAAGDSATSAPAAILPRLIVTRVTAPVGTFSNNEKVWTELSEDALDSKTSVLMAQNGLRAGIAPLSRWANIKKLIDGPGVSYDQIVCQTDGRSSVSVMTRLGVTGQIVMSIDRDLRQQGRSFERCDNGFKLSIRGIRGKPLLQISIEPFVSLGTVMVHRTGHELGITGRGMVSEESFPDLQMSAPLGADQFLLISSVDPKSNPFSIGSLWLADADKVPAVETVLIFSPPSEK